MPGGARGSGPPVRTGGDRAGARASRAVATYRPRRGGRGGAGAFGNRQGGARPIERRSRQDASRTCRRDRHGIAVGGPDGAEIGRAHVCTPVTNAHLVCRLLLEKKNSFLDYLILSCASHNQQYT